MGEIRNQINRNKNGEKISLEARVSMVSIAIFFNSL
jgi:hypothetical protein